jgi:hypothetical protein
MNPNTWDTTYFGGIVIIMVSAVSVPLPLEWKSSLQFVATRYCNPLAQSFASDWFSVRASDQAAGVGDEDLKAQGISSSMRDCGWPSAIASSVAFIQA